MRTIFQKGEVSMKKILWAMVAVLALGMACFFVGCGPKAPSESEMYAAVAGEYSGATNNTVTDDQNQQTDVWDNVLTVTHFYGHYDNRLTSALKSSRMSI